MIEENGGMSARVLQAGWDGRTIANRLVVPSGLLGCRSYLLACDHRDPNSLLNCSSCSSTLHDSIRAAW